MSILLLVMLLIGGGGLYFGSPILEGVGLGFSLLILLLFGSRVLRPEKRTRVR